MKFFDCHSHWGTEKGHIFRTPEELARLKDAYQKAYDTFMAETNKQPRDQAAWQAAFAAYQQATNAYFKARGGTQ